MSDILKNSICAPYGTAEEMAQSWPSHKVQELQDVLTSIFKLSETEQSTTDQQMVLKSS